MGLTASSPPIAGTNYDAVLDNIGLLLVPNTLRQNDITSFSPAVRDTDPRYQDFSLSQFWVQRSWHKGRGQFEWGDQSAYFDQSNLDTRIRGQVTIAPAQNLTTKAAAASVAGNPVCFRLFTTAASLYLATGGASRDVFSWNNSSSVWAAETAGLTADPTDMTEFQGVIYVAQGDGTVMRKKSGGAWSDVTGAGGGNDAMLFTQFGQQTMYRAVNVNEIYYTVDGSTWSGPIYVGDNNTNIRGLAVGEGKLWIGKDDGLYYLQDGVVYQALDFQWARDSNNFRNVRYWQGALYFPILTGLYRYTSGGLQSVGPDRGAGFLSDPRQPQPSAQNTASGSRALRTGYRGKIVDMSAGENFLYCAIDGGTDLLSASTNISQVMAFDGDSWHQIVEGAAAAKRIRTVFITGQLASTNVFSRPRLWYGYDVDPYQIILPFGTDDPYDYSGQTYLQKSGSTASLQTSWYDAGLANVYKSWQKIHLYTEGLSATSFIGVDVEFDDTGVYSTLATFHSSPYQVFTIPNSVASKKLRLRFTFDNSTGAATDTPKLKACVIQFQVRPPTRFSWRVTMRAGRDIQNPYTLLKEKFNPVEWKQRLLAYRKFKTPLRWDDGEIEPGITNLITNPSFRGTPGAGNAATNWTKVGDPLATFTLSQLFSVNGFTSQIITCDTDASAQGIRSPSATVVAGKRYTASCYVAKTATERCFLEVIRASDSVLLAEVEITQVNPGNTFGGTTVVEFNRVECTFMSATTAVYLRVVRRAVDASAGVTLYASCAQLELTPDDRFANFENKATSYCDGDMEDCAWSGTPYASTSTRLGYRTVFVTNIDLTETMRESAQEIQNGSGIESRITFTVADAP